MHVGLLPDYVKNCYSYIVIVRQVDFKYGLPFLCDHFKNTLTMYECTSIEATHLVIC